MDRNLKDKAHFIISQTIWNNKNGKAVFCEQIYDRCLDKFQDEINGELYKLIEEGGGGQGKPGKTPVLVKGDITTLPAGSDAQFDIVYIGNNTEGNPIYRIDMGLPRGDKGSTGSAGKNGIDGTDGINGVDGKTAIFQIGDVVTIDAGGQATANIRRDGQDIDNNPIYKVDFGVPKGNKGDTPDLTGYATELFVTQQIQSSIGVINTMLDELNGEII